MSINSDSFLNSNLGLISLPPNKKNKQTNKTNQVINCFVVWRWSVESKKLNQTLFVFILLIGLLFSRHVNYGSKK